MGWFKENLDTLLSLQKKAVKIISGAKYNDHTNPLFNNLNILKFNDAHELSVYKLMYMYSKKQLPSPISYLFTDTNEIHAHDTRNRINAHHLMRRTMLASISIRHLGSV